LLAEIETDKITVEIRAAQAGTIVKRFAKKGDTVRVGSELYQIRPGTPLLLAKKPLSLPSLPPPPHLRLLLQSLQLLPPLLLHLLLPAAAAPRCCCGCVLQLRLLRL
jgi:hypothetical protein